VRGEFDRLQTASCSIKGVAQDAINDPHIFLALCPKCHALHRQKNTERITYGSMEISRAVGMNTAFLPAILWKYFAMIRPEGGGHMGLMNVLLCTAKAVEKNPCQSLSVRKRDRLGQVL
jgi:hypothetical protein